MNNKKIWNMQSILFAKNIIEKYSKLEEYDFDAGILVYLQKTDQESEQKNGKGITQVVKKITNTYVDNRQFHSISGGLRKYINIRYDRLYPQISLTSKMEVKPYSLSQSFFHILNQALQGNKLPNSKELFQRTVRRQQLNFQKELLENSIVDMAAQLFSKNISMSQEEITLLKTDLLCVLREKSQEGNYSVVQVLHEMIQRKESQMQKSYKIKRMETAEENVLKVIQEIPEMVWNQVAEKTEFWKGFASQAEGEENWRSITNRIEREENWRSITNQTELVNLLKEKNQEEKYVLLQRLNQMVEQWETKAYHAQQEAGEAEGRESIPLVELQKAIKEYETEYRRRERDEQQLYQKIEKYKNIENKETVESHREIEEAERAVLKIIQEIPETVWNQIAEKTELWKGFASQAEGEENWRSITNQTELVNLLKEKNQEEKYVLLQRMNQMVEQWETKAYHAQQEAGEAEGRELVPLVELQKAIKEYETEYRRRERDEQQLYQKIEKYKNIENKETVERHREIEEAERAVLKIIQEMPETVWNQIAEKTELWKGLASQAEGEENWRSITNRIELEENWRSITNQTELVNLLKEKNQEEKYVLLQRLNQMVEQWETKAYHAQQEEGEAEGRELVPLVELQKAIKEYETEYQRRERDEQQLYQKIEKYKNIENKKTVERHREEIEEAERAVLKIIQEMPEMVWNQVAEKTEFWKGFASQAEGEENWRSITNHIEREENWRSITNQTELVNLLKEKNQEEKYVLLQRLNQMVEQWETKAYHAKQEAGEAEGRELVPLVELQKAIKEYETEYRRRERDEQQLYQKIEKYKNIENKETVERHREIEEAERAVLKIIQEMPETVWNQVAEKTEFWKGFKNHTELVNLLKEKNQEEKYMLLQRLNQMVEQWETKVYHAQQEAGEAEGRESIPLVELQKAIKEYETEYRRRKRDEQQLYQKIEKYKNIENKETVESHREIEEAERAVLKIIQEMPETVWNQVAEKTEFWKGFKNQTELVNLLKEKNQEEKYMLLQRLNQMVEQWETKAYHAQQEAGEAEGREPVPLVELQKAIKEYETEYRRRERDEQQLYQKIEKYKNIENKETVERHREIEEAERAVLKIIQEMPETVWNQVAEKTEFWKGFASQAEGEENWRSIINHIEREENWRGITNQTELVNLLKEKNQEEKYMLLQRLNQMVEQWETKAYHAQQEAGEAEGREPVPLVELQKAIKEYETEYRRRERDEQQLYQKIEKYKNIENKETVESQREIEEAEKAVLKIIQEMPETVWNQIAEKSELWKGLASQAEGEENWRSITNHTALVNLLKEKNQEEKYMLLQRLNQMVEQWETKVYHAQQEAGEAEGRESIPLVELQKAIKEYETEYQRRERDEQQLYQKIEKYKNIENKETVESHREIEEAERAVLKIIQEMPETVWNQIAEKTQLWRGIVNQTVQEENWRSITTQTELVNVLKEKNQEEKYVLLQRLNQMVEKWETKAYHAQQEAGEAEGRESIPLVELQKAIKEYETEYRRRERDQQQLYQKVEKYKKIENREIEESHREIEEAGRTVLKVNQKIPEMVWDQIAEKTQLWRGIVNQTVQEENWRSITTQTELVNVLKEKNQEEKYVLLQRLNQTVEKWETKAYHAQQEAGEAEGRAIVPIMKFQKAIRGYKAEYQKKENSIIYKKTSSREYDEVVSLKSKIQEFQYLQQVQKEVIKNLQKETEIQRRQVEELMEKQFYTEREFTESKDKFSNSMMNQLKAEMHLERMRYGLE